MKYIAIILIGLMGVAYGQVSNFSGKNQEKILRKLKLTEKERDLLQLSKELFEESKLNIKEAEEIEKEIGELKEVMEVSKNFKDIYEKAKRKALRNTQYVLSLRIEANEYNEMGNSMIYAIMENHYDDISYSGKFSEENINQLKKEAGMLYKQAKNARKKSYDAFDDFTTYQKLVEANDLEEQALVKQQVLYADIYDIVLEKKSTRPEYGQLVTENTETPETPVSIEIKVENEMTDIVEKSVVQIETLVLDEYINIPLETRIKQENIIYKVQVGAFLNQVNEKEFMGLSPLTVDENDEEIYIKYMVGEYVSYNAACNARKVIIESMGYRDAFIVAYSGGERIEITSEMKSKTDFSSNLNMAIR